MQYLLTEAEYHELTRKAETRSRLEADKLQDVCTLAAQHIPVARPWMGEEAAPAPWGCILVVGPGNPGYCDDCPVSAVCPYPRKEWSK